MPYHFQRPEKLSAELKLWERLKTLVDLKSSVSNVDSARATSAAPKIFKPFHHETTRQTYLDGAIYHNNPVIVADRERKLIWPSFKATQPDIFVSIGTAYYPRPDYAIPTPIQKPHTPRLGVDTHFAGLLKIATDHIAASLNSQEVWRVYLGTINPSPEDTSRFVRLNPVLDEDPPKLDDVRAMRPLQEKVRSQLYRSQRYDKLAGRLLATLFYFKQDVPGPAVQSSLEVQGM